jgi:hypothetical protein
MLAPIVIPRWPVRKYSNKNFDGYMMTNERSGASLAHFRIIRRTGAKPTAQAAGGPMLRAGRSAFTQPIGAALPPFLAPRAMVQALAGMLAFRNCSAPPGRVQEPPRPVIPPRWVSAGICLRWVQRNPSTLCARGAAHV